MNQLLRSYIPKDRSSALSIAVFVLLVLCGAYVTLFFIGTSGHMPILMEGGDAESIRQSTNSTSLRGLYGFGAFVQYLLARLYPFLTYAILCGVAYVAYVAYNIVAKGRLYIDTHLSTLHIVGISIACLWLIFTTLFYAPLNGMQQRLLVEPTPEIYKNIGPEGIQVLQENFVNLKDSGCLYQDPNRIGPNQKPLYWYKTTCAQSAFFTRVLTPLLFLLLVTFNAFVLGRAFLWAIRLPQRDRLVEALMSFGVGLSLLTAVVWLLALLHILHSPMAAAALIIIPAAGWKWSLYWIRAAWEYRWRVRVSFYDISILLVWLLISYLAFNYLTVVRPFPIGWDDLGRYINLPRQLSSVGKIVHVIPAIQWEYLTSLPFVIFGYYSTFASTAAMQVNWMGGLFAVLAVFTCARLVLGKRAGLLSALFYYTLPMTGHFSFADMKTENPLFAYGVCGLVAICVYLFGVASSDEGATNEHESKRKWNWLLVAGMLFAAGFATKPTVILLAFMGGVMLSFRIMGAVGGIGSMFLCFAILTQGGFSVDAVLQKLGHPNPSLGSIPFVIFGLIGIVLLGASAFLQKKEGPDKRIKRYLQICGVLIGGFALFSFPWMMHNFTTHPSGSSFALSRLLSASTEAPSIVLTPQEMPSDPIEGSRHLPEDLAIDPAHQNCKGTARTEELDRYWGYGDGWKHYLNLPWRNVMNIDAQGYYLTLSPLLLLVPFLLLYPMFWKKNNRLRYLFWATMACVVQWVIMANGIPWYGIAMFLGLSLCVEGLIRYAPDQPTRFITCGLFIISIMTAFSMRLWQFEMQRNLYEYAWGKVTDEVIREMTIPHYNNIADRVTELSKNPDRPYLYRIGTFIPYFIPNNVKAIPQNDNQLVFFNCLNQERDHALTLKRLLALGFHSIVFDTNTATIERNPQGTLHKKVEAFVNFVNDQNNSRVQPVVNAPTNGIVYVVLPES